jgi:hypothetical protein
MNEMKKIIFYTYHCLLQKNVAFSPRVVIFVYGNKKESDKGDKIYSLYSIFLQGDFEIASSVPYRSEKT